MTKELNKDLLLAVANKVNEEDKNTLLGIIEKGVSEDKFDTVYQLAYLMLDEVKG
tara:strand:- start:169 stop:333 length:165 start_codon:yes stop_codon:yes gene_type:complete